MAGRLAGRGDLRVTLSLAGRTASPAPQPVPVRSGGFGGAAGLADYLVMERIDALIDATHPYAAIISANAAAAAHKTKVPFVALRRPPWIATDGDRWIEVRGVREAVQALGPTPRRVFVALGRNELAPLQDAPAHHYLIRSVDPVDPPLPLPHVSYVTGRGPFREADDRALMEAHRIDTIIAKNSGGAATYGKIAAARAWHRRYYTAPAIDPGRTRGANRGRRDRLARSCAYLRDSARRVNQRRLPRSGDDAGFA